MTPIDLAPKALLTRQEIAATLRECAEEQRELGLTKMADETLMRAAACEAGGRADWERPA